MSHSEEVLRGIKTRLLVSYPFFGSALSDLPLIPDKGVRRFYSNGNSIFYNDEFVNHATPQDLAYWLCREILQLTMDYGGRKKQRSPLLWAIAAEYCVNSILSGEGLSKGVQIRFYRREYAGKSAEEIYAILVRESISRKILEKIEDLDSWLFQQEKPLDLSEREQDFSGIARIMKLNADGLKEILEEWEKRRGEYGNYKAKTLEMISKARLSERTLGKMGFTVDLPIIAESMERLRWEDILSQYAFNDRESHSYRRYQRKYVSSGIYLPQRFHMFNSIIVCIDVSASIGEETMSSFFSDVLFLAGSRQREASVRLIQIDAQVQSDVVVDPAASPASILRRRGFGGTDFTPLFSLLDGQNNHDPVVIFTDGRAIFPDIKPEGYDVAWVTTDLFMPWGINIGYGGNIEA